MNPLEAYNLIQKYHDEPVFNVKIGCGSNQIKNSTFHEALVEFDRCSRFSTEYLEFVYIYATSYITESNKIDEALSLFNLGHCRHLINKYEKGE